MVPYIFLSLSPTFQWAVSGETEQEWWAKESREDRTNVCPFYSMCKFSFPSLLSCWLYPGACYVDIVTLETSIYSYLPLFLHTGEIRAWFMFLSDFNEIFKENWNQL